MRKLCYILFCALMVVACNRHDHTHIDQAVSVKYTCPMHPQIIQDKPGQCPICGMNLVKMGKKNIQDRGMMLSETQIRLGNIKTTRTHYHDVKNTTVLNGRLSTNEDQTEIISCRVKGRIDKLYVKEIGQSIKNGQPLYEIYSEELSVLEQEYLLAVRQYDEFKTDRYGGLIKAAAGKLFLLGVTKNQVEKLGITKTVDARLVFNAPTSGIVSTIAVEEGKYVEEGETLYKVENIDKLWVNADLYANETHAVYVGDSISVQIGGFENNPVSGKVLFVNPEFNAGTQILVLRAIIPNPEHRFFPGMRANIVLSDVEKKVISLPTDAVIHEEDESHVWVLNPDGSYAPRRVLTGLEGDDNVEIRYGLEENENVVTTGAYLLYSEYVLKRGASPSFN